MGSRVKYRDLPGGPAELKFCDELTRHCLCTNCNMLSMSMLQDTNRHMFCETCLTETSEKHHRVHIYCKHENKEVSIFEMFDAHALITVIRDQHVMCPYQDCKDVITLVQLKDHYKACHPTVTCATCKQQVQTAEWSNHSKDCRERGAYKTQPKATIPKQVQHKDAPSSPNSSPSVKMDGYLNNGRTFKSMYPSSNLQQAQKPTDDGSEEIMLCLHCEKKVKKRNMPQHLDKCLKAPQLCAYCEKEFSKEKIKSHLAVCTANPGNIPEQPPERKWEGPNPKAASLPEAQGSPSASYAAVVRDGKRAEGNTSTSATTRSAGARRKTTPQVGSPPPAKGKSESCRDAQQAEIPADSPVWLQCLSSGDLIAAFAAFEESFSGRKMDEQFMYTQFTTAFVQTKIREMVRDVLEDPSRTQPLNCLMVALFARASLPPKVWAKRMHEVTWKDVLKYLPSVLVSRLNKRKVMAYLRNYPVFLGEADTSHVVGTSSGTEEHPHNDSKCRHSTNPAAAASDVANAPVNAEDDRDAPDVVKGDSLDGGGPAGEKPPSLRAEERTQRQPAAKDEEYMSDRGKFRDGKGHPKEDPKTRVEETDAPFLRDPECAQERPTSDQMQPPTDGACFLAGPSSLDTVPSSREGGINHFNSAESIPYNLDPFREQPRREEGRALVSVEEHSTSKMNCLNLDSYRSETTSFGRPGEGYFPHTAAKTERTPKAKNITACVDSSAMQESSELLRSMLQPQNDHTLKIPRKDSDLGAVLLANVTSSAVGTTQAGNFSSSAHDVFLTKAEVLHVDGNDTTGCRTPSTKNAPFLEHEHPTRDGHSKGILPERAPKIPKCNSHRSDGTSFGSPDETYFLHAATNTAKATEARSTSTTVGDRALRDDRAFLTAQRQFQSGHTQNMACKKTEPSAKLKSYFSSFTEGTMQEDGFSTAAEVVSGTHEDVLPVQRTSSTEHETPSTKKDLFRELTDQARTVPKRFVSDSAPLTANDVSARDTRALTLVASVPLGRVLNSPPDLACLQARSESVASIKNVTTKENMSSDAESEEYFRGSKPDFVNDDILSKISRLSISREGSDEPTTLTTDQSTCSQLSQGIPLQGQPYQAGGQPTEASAPPESLQEPLRSNTRSCRSGRSNSVCWTTGL